MFTNKMKTYKNYRKELNDAKTNRRDCDDCSILHQRIRELRDNGAELERVIACFNTYDSEDEPSKDYLLVVRYLNFLCIAVSNKLVEIKHLQKNFAMSKDDEEWFKVNHERLANLRWFVAEHDELCELLNLDI